MRPLTQAIFNKSKVETETRAPFDACAVQLVAVSLSKAQVQGIGRLTP